MAWVTTPSMPRTRSALVGVRREGFRYLRAMGRKAARHRADTARKQAICAQMFSTPRERSSAASAPAENQMETRPTVRPSTTRKTTRATSQRMVGSIRVPPFMGSGTGGPERNGGCRGFPETLVVSYHIPCGKSTALPGRLGRILDGFAPLGPSGRVKSPLFASAVQKGLPCGGKSDILDGKHSCVSNWVRHASQKCKHFFEGMQAAARMARRATHLRPEQSVFRRTRRRKTRFDPLPPSADGGTLRGSCI